MHVRTAGSWRDSLVAAVDPAASSMNRDYACKHECTNCLGRCGIFDSVHRIVRSLLLIQLPKQFSVLEGLRVRYQAIAKSHVCWYVRHETMVQALWIFFVLVCRKSSKRDIAKQNVWNQPSTPIRLLNLCLKHFYLDTSLFAHLYISHVTFSIEEPNLSVQHDGSIARRSVQSWISHLDSHWVCIRHLHTHTLLGCLHHFHLHDILDFRVFTVLHVGVSVRLMEGSTDDKHKEQGIIWLMMIDMNRTDEMNYSITTRTRSNSIVEDTRARAHHSRYKAPSYFRSHDVCYVGKGSWWNTAGPGKEGTHEVQYPSRSAVSQQNDSFLTPRRQKTPPPRRPVRNDPVKPMPSFLLLK